MDKCKPFPLPISLCHFFSFGPKMMLNVNCLHFMFENIHNSYVCLHYSYSLVWSGDLFCWLFLSVCIIRMKITYLTMKKVHQASPSQVCEMLLMTSFSCLLVFHDRNVSLLTDKSQSTSKFRREVQEHKHQLQRLKEKVEKPFFHVLLKFHNSCRLRYTNTIYAPFKFCSNKRQNIYPKCRMISSDILI